MSMINLSQYLETFLSRPTYQSYSSIDHTATDNVPFTFESTVSHRCYNCFEFILGYCLLFSNWVNLDSFVTRTSYDELFIRRNWYTCDCPCMCLVTHDEIIIFSVEQRKFTILWHWCQIFSRPRVLHGVDSIRVMRNNLENFPSLSWPNNDAGSLFCQSFATCRHKLAIWASANALKLMRMTIQFIHFWPKRMLDQIIIMRWHTEVYFLRLLDIHFFLLYIQSLFIILIVVIHNLFSFYSLNLSHQTQYLTTSLSVSFVK